MASSSTHVLQIEMAATRHLANFSKGYKFKNPCSVLKGHTANISISLHNKIKRNSVYEYLQRNQNNM